MRVREAVLSMKTCAHQLKFTSLELQFEMNCPKLISAWMDNYTDCLQTIPSWQDQYTRLLLKEM